MILLKKKNFGQSSEKTTKQIEEIEFRLEENETLEQQVVDENEILVNLESSSNDEMEQSQPNQSNMNAQSASKNKPKRKPLPENLPREVVEIPAPAN